MADLRSQIAAVRAEMELRPAGLVAHVRRVAKTAGELAERWDIDPRRLELAVWGHDLFRHLGPEEMLALAAEAGIEPDPVEASEPVFLHGPLAAKVLEGRFGVTDREILEAAARHTTSAPDQTAFEKVLFLADKVEPQKARRKGWDVVARLAFEDLDAALLRYLDLVLIQAVEKGWPVHDLTHQTRNALVLRRRLPGPAHL